MASVEPRFVGLNGTDPVAYILSSNIARRHLTTGQRAMLTAKAITITGHSQREAAADSNLNQARIGQATTILEYSPHLAERVVAGTMLLTHAYEATPNDRTAGDADGEGA